MVWFPLRAIVNSAISHILVHVGQHMCLFLLEIFLKVEFLDHKEGLCSILVDNIKDFLQNE